MTNIFEEVGFDKADQLYAAILAKAKSHEDAVGKLGDAIQKELERIGLGQPVNAIAVATGLKPTHIRRLLAGEFLRFTLAQLVDIALDLDMQIEVRVKKAKTVTPD